MMYLMDWTLEPGDQILRTQLHKLLGGRTQGGISPSAKSPNVMLFTDPKVGQHHGYNDGWGSDGCFHYTGEGQFGDQRMAQGNRTVLDHEEEGRALRLFRGVGGAVEYLGAFTLDPFPPWYSTEAQESGGGDVRKVIVFRLRPSGRVIHDPLDSLPPLVSEEMTIVPVENMNTERFVINPSAESKEGEKREQKLVVAYVQYMKSKGSTIRRNRFRPKGEPKPLFSDLFDEERQNLIEAKGTVTREAIRMIIGQLADYSRFLPSCRKGALLPERPRPDLEALLGTQDIAAIWPTAPGLFEDNGDGQFS